MQYIYDSNFWMFQVRENEISLRKWCGGTAQLRTLEGTLCVATLLTLFVQNYHHALAWCIALRVAYSQFKPLWKSCAEYRMLQVFGSFRLRSTGCRFGTHEAPFGCGYVAKDDVDHTRVSCLNPVGLFVWYLASWLCRVRKHMLAFRKGGRLLTSRRHCMRLQKEVLSFNLRCQRVLVQLG